MTNSIIIVVVFLLIGMLVQQQKHAYALSFQHQHHHHRHHCYDHHRRYRRHNRLGINACRLKSASSIVSTTKRIVTMPTSIGSLELKLGVLSSSSSLFATNSEHNPSSSTISSLSSREYEKIKRHVGVTSLSLSTKNYNKAEKHIELLARWEQMFDLLMSYQQREKHCNVPRSHKEEGQNLGYWVNTQREYKKLGKLKDERIQRLTDLGFTFSAKKQEWEKMLVLLVQYTAREGHCRVPQNHKEEDENLGKWLGRQRTAMRNGKLNKEYQRRLEEVGAVLNTNQNKQKWENMFALLVHYKDREGHCRVPDLYKEEDENLGRWLSNQRVNMKNEKLSDDYQCQLEEISVVWRIRDVRSDKNWEEMYEFLMQFNDREGHCLVPQRHKEDDENLGKWLTTQRTAKSRGKLSDERLVQLEDIGVVWKIRVRSTKNWEDMYGLLMQFNGIEGHCRVPQIHKEDDESLGSWLSYQRLNMKNGKLSEDYQCQLREIGVVTRDVRFAKKWEEMYELLIQFNEREGHCRVPYIHKEDDKNLGMWLNNKRKVNKEGKLSDDYQRQLEEIGALLETRVNWEDMYELLMQFNEREGHCRVPRLHKEDDQNLGTWLYSQGIANKKGKLRNERRIQFEEIGVVWNIRVRSIKNWEDMYELLMQFNEREGHCKIPQNHKEDDENLGMWLNNQRRTANKKGKLSEERRCQLEDCGVVLDPSSRQ